MTVRPLAGLLIAIAAAVGSPGAASADQRPACSLILPELARGFSLTGWFDETVPRPPDFATLATLRERGMTHVRLPVRAEDFMPRYTAAAIIEQRRAAIEAGLDALLSAGYAVVLDLHGGQRLGALFTLDPDAAANAVIHAWSVLGPMVERRAARKVFAEVLNEPPTNDATWAVLQPRIVTALRRVMPTTTLILSTGGPQRVEALVATHPQADRNTVWAVHYYDPMAFTHQGASWIRPDPIGWLHGVPFPIAAGDPRLIALASSLRSGGLSAVADYVDSLRNRSFQVADIRRDFTALGNWSRANGRQVVIGEFGVYRAVVDPADRRAWLTAVTEAGLDACLGWTHWDYRDGFGFIDPRTGRPDEATMSGLVGIGAANSEPGGDGSLTTTTGAAK